MLFSWQTVFFSDAHFSHILECVFSTYQLPEEVTLQSLYIHSLYFYGSFYCFAGSSACLRVEVNVFRFSQFLHIPRTRRYTVFGATIVKMYILNMRLCCTLFVLIIMMLMLRCVADCGVIVIVLKHILEFFSLCDFLKVLDL